MHTGFLSREGMLSVLANFDGVIEDFEEKKIKLTKIYLLIDSLKK